MRAGDAPAQVVVLALEVVGHQLLGAVGVAAGDHPGQLGVLVDDAGRAARPGPSSSTTCWVTMWVTAWVSRLSTGLSAAW